jgi:hypothetical protein
MKNSIHQCLLICFIATFAFYCKKKNDPAPGPTGPSATLTYDSITYTPTPTYDSVYPGTYTQYININKFNDLSLSYDYKLTRDTTLDLTKQDIVEVEFYAPDTYIMFPKSGTLVVKVSNGYITSTCSNGIFERDVDHTVTAPLTFSVTTH